MANGYLSAEFVTRYARPPAETTISQAVATHESVRELLGGSDYVTLLQGSYKNSTALWDMNDVDIVAISKSLVSSHFSGAPVVNNGVSWPEIFSRIEQKLQLDKRYQGKWTRGDKCIRLNAGINIDIVPAVRIGEAIADPIAVYSLRAGKERKNWPRGHFDAGAAKSEKTNGAFKQTVRLFKRWSRCWFSDRKIAPSYYLENLVCSRPDSSFSGNLAQDFVTVSESIAQMRYGYSALPRMAGEGNLLSADEWGLAQFNEFQRQIQRVVPYANAALRAPSESHARANWIAAFNGQQAS